MVSATIDVSARIIDDFLICKIGRKVIVFCAHQSDFGDDCERKNMWIVGPIAPRQTYGLGLRVHFAVWNELRCSLLIEAGVEMVETTRRADIPVSILPHTPSLP